MKSHRPVVVAGAGAIGCFVGGMLAFSGRRVSLLARSRIKAEIEQFGLRLTDFDGTQRQLTPDRLTISDNPEILRDARIVLVTVKSAATSDIAELIALHAPDDALIVSLQNGIGNVALLRKTLPGRPVLGGMVPFNVIATGEGIFHRGTSGDIQLESDAANTAATLSVPGLSMRATPNIAGVQWGKLIINLNNALNALSDLPIATQLASREWRMLFADQIGEGLAALSAAGIKPVATTPIPPRWMAPLLRLPDPIFAMVLGRTMKIDPQARSSMWQDLKQGRTTEIDYLQGAIIALAEGHHVDVPLSRQVVALIKQYESAGHGPPKLTPQKIRGATGSASSR